MKEPVAGPDGGKMGLRGKGANWRTESSAMLQSSNLGKGQWFVAGLMVKFYTPKNGAARKLLSR